MIQPFTAGYGYLFLVSGCWCRHVIFQGSLFDKVTEVKQKMFCMQLLMKIHHRLSIPVDVSRSGPRNPRRKLGVTQCYNIRQKLESILIVNLGKKFNWHQSSLMAYKNDNNTSGVSCSSQKLKNNNCSRRYLIDKLRNLTRYHTDAFQPPRYYRLIYPQYLQRTLMDW